MAVGSSYSTSVNCKNVLLMGGGGGGGGGEHSMYIMEFCSI